MNLYRKNLTQLPVKFGVVTGYFDCNGNQLTTLRGAPERVDGDFSCHYNQLTTLEFAPEGVSGDILYQNNPLPGEILRLTQKQRRILFEYQRIYGIWRDGKLFLPRFNILLEDMEDGVLD